LTGNLVSEVQLKYTPARGFVLYLAWSPVAKSRQRARRSFCERVACQGAGVEVYCVQKVDFLLMARTLMFTLDDCTPTQAMPPRHATPRHAMPHVSALWNAFPQHARTARTRE
jgi:hypothetical protein